MSVSSPLGLGCRQERLTLPVVSLSLEGFTLWKSYLFSWRIKLDMLQCLKCFGRIDLVNFSPCNPSDVIRFESSPLLTHFLDDKGIAVFAPSRNILVRGIFQHSVLQSAPVFVLVRPFD